MSIVVVSPHLDDGVLSLGAFLARAARGGAHVTVLTVLAGSPNSASPPGPWDAACGFRTAGEAARLRREEDRRACAVIGATPVWLPFGDQQYGVGADDTTVLAAMAEAIGKVETLLVPGFPLWHHDHRWLARLVVENGLGNARIGCYVEQPYALWHSEDGPTDPEGLPVVFSGPLTWHRVGTGSFERLAKTRACRAYRTQLPRFGRRPVMRIQWHEFQRGGEQIAWLGPINT